MVRILEADSIGYLAHGLVRACQRVLDAVDDGKVDVFDGGLARFLLDEVAEIVGGKMELVGTPSHGGQTDLFRLVGIKIAGHQVLETSEDIAVDGLAGGKLTVVETEAMVEQYLDVGGDDAAAVLVDAVMQFFLYLVETVKDGLAFSLGHVQGFVHFIGKERVFLHLAGKACATQQVGMEQQAIALGIGRFATVVDACHLTGSHKYQRAFLIIILASSVSQLSVYLLFQVDAVETIELLFMLQNFDLTEVDKRNQRVECFYS